jgi:hypothetical protein
MEAPRLANSHLTLGFDRQTGALAQLRFKNRNFIAPILGKRPLVELNFRDASGEALRVSSTDFPPPRFVARDGSMEIEFDAWDSLRVRVTISIALAEDSDESFWRIETEHGREGYLEWIEFPRVVVPNDLGAVGGDARLLWPALEGVLIEDLAHREKSPLPYQEIEYPNHGWCGYYPGAAAFQFLTYESGGSILYFGSHDPRYTTKEIEYCRDDDGIRLIQKVYLDAGPAGKHELAYPVVLAAMEGDWYAAAGRYRRWSESVNSAIRISERTDLPPWIHDSPIVVTYPVTGHGHHSGKTDPNEFFPFIRALPVLEKLGDALDSRLLVLLMHWEGTAPWAPPYVWPPRGGETGLREFADSLHSRNHLLGLYCSGTAWTNTADTGDGTYNRTAEFKRDHLIRYMCRGPRGEYRCKICNGEGIRLGYDICPATDFARDVMAGEANKIAASGIDYIQLFDQNLGCAAYQCHDTAHGHSAAPGAWGAPAMRGLLAHVRASLNASGAPHVLLGCEAAAAEPYLHDLPINDLRFHMGFCMGRPVPAYSYLFHEYGCNFMGNQVEALMSIDEKASPWNLALRLAHSFIAGDLLAIVLNGKGELHWSWCTKWEVPPPPQEPHLAFIRRLNAWRRGAGSPFLCGGRMLSPAQVAGAECVPLAIRWGLQLDYSAVLTSHWQSQAGAQAHFLVNFLDRPQRIRMALGGHDEACVITQPSGSDMANIPVREGCLELDISGLSAVMIRT